jgi:hypothetical protein
VLNITPTTRLLIHDTAEVIDYHIDIDTLGARFHRTQWDLLPPFPEAGFGGGLVLRLYNPDGEWGLPPSRRRSAPGHRGNPGGRSSLVERHSSTRGWY